MKNLIVVCNEKHILRLRKLFVSPEYCTKHFTEIATFIYHSQGTFVEIFPAQQITLFHFEQVSTNFLVK